LQQKLLSERLPLVGKIFTPSAKNRELAPGFRRELKHLDFQNADEAKISLNNPQMLLKQILPQFYKFDVNLWRTQNTQCHIFS